MKFSLKTLIWGCILLALILAGTFALMPQPVEVEAAKVVEGPLKVTVQEDGKTEIREKYVVSTPVAGRLSRIELRSGDICDEKTLLAVILPSNPTILDARARAEANARVLAAEAALQRAESNEEQAAINLELSSQKYERTKKLLERSAVAQEDYDEAKTEYLTNSQATKTSKFDADIARYELEQAKAAVQQFSGSTDESSVEPFEIFSPISGRVLRVFQESSTVVAVSTELLEIGDPQNLEIKIDVLSTDAVRIKPGAELTIDYWGGDLPLRGIVRVIEPAAFTKISSLGVEEQRVNIIGDFTEPPERLATLGDGYRVEARITVAELASALLVPSSALFRYQRDWHVLAIVEDHAVMRRVKIGLQNESQTQILEGLKAGEQVIVYPNDELSTGTLVKVVDEKS